MSSDTRITVVRGDITQQRVDGIVNAANAALCGGGGVDGAIHRAGGPEILEECRRIRGGCPTGSAVLTTAGNLPAKKVIHAVGPVWWDGNRGEREQLASVYRGSLELAVEHGLRTIAFPSISTGAYKFPISEAAKIALGTVEEFCSEHPGVFDEIRFVLFSAGDERVYQKAVSSI